MNYISNSFSLNMLPASMPGRCTFCACPLSRDGTADGHRPQRVSVVGHADTARCFQRSSVSPSPAIAPPSR
jgi:hypothetical protein